MIDPCISQRYQIVSRCSENHQNTQRMRDAAYRSAFDLNVESGRL